MDVGQAIVEVGLLVATFATSFFLPGISGIFVGGLIHFLADMGIRIANNNLPQNPIFYVNRLISLFMPFLQKFKIQKLPLLVKVENYVSKIDKLLTKAKDLFMNDLVKLTSDPKNLFNRASGLTENIENDIKKLDVQNKVKQVLGQDIVKTEPLYRRAPNTKNLESWIMSVEFWEVARFGKTIIGQMTINYCSNNKYRIGKRFVPIDKIVYGRTSQGKINRTEEKANKERYREVKSTIDNNRWEIRRVTFENCSFYGDFLPFLRSFSWGGYYMRKWMIGMPGSSNVLSPILFAGSIRRIEARVEALVRMAKEMGTNPKYFFTKKGQEFGWRYLGAIKIGQKTKLAKYTNVFRKVVIKNKGFSVKDLKQKTKQQIKRFQRKIIKKRKKN